MQESKDPQVAEEESTNYALMAFTSSSSSSDNEGNPQHALEDKGVIDSGCSRHMTGNMSYLSNFEELNSGYVTFGGNPKGGKISREDENQVLLRVPRENNMYHVDLKNIVPSGYLTCLFAKKTLDESNLWESNIEPIERPSLSVLSINPYKGVQEQFDSEKAREENVQQYVLFPVWSSGSNNPRNTNGDAAFNEKEPEFERRKPEFEVNVSPRSSAQSKKHDNKTKREAKGKSPVESLTRYRNLSVKFEDFSNNNMNEDNTADTLSTNGKSSHIDTSQYPDDPNMLELEDITYSDDEDDVGAEADFNILETTITEDGIDYEEVFALVARIEAIRLFLAYTSFMGFMVYQVDVKSAFIYGTIKEEVYVYQPPGFDDPDYPDKFSKRKDRSDIVYEKAESHDKYVAKILRKFGLTDRTSASTPIDTEKPLLKDPDGEDVDMHTYRSMIGSLMYLTSSRLDIMFAVCACARFQVTPKASHLHVVKRIIKDSPFNLVAYSDSDYVGASLDRKSTIEGCQFLRYRLISYQCKKQTVVATSSTKAEYVAAASCCAQVLWIQNQLLDFRMCFSSFGLTMQVDLRSMKALKRMLHVTNILSAG
uniref:Uncharacterized mitochondrial protein AtMg00810-like n=1 Tax=Tanacetum cinerariifolium TaxID=118510 RepID=A0A699HN19_TANCI|nr:uncharacterized mitochondrial protein AtMg00810-like [Tanacetum cinerariifolium]